MFHHYRCFQLLPILLCSFAFPVKSQEVLSVWEPSPRFHKNRFTTVVVTEGMGYIGAMYGLDALWYRNHPRSGFHFFNDNAQWLQMDKAGHVATAYYIGYAGMQALRWSGVSNKKSIWYGGALGLFFQTSLEILDGFSEQWGASTGDLMANAGGTALLIGQEYLWGEQRFRIKVSAHLTRYAPFRPAVLGRSVAERLFKDYNGQTYWISANVASFLKPETRFPGWLNVALGYSADGMTYGGPDLPDTGHSIVTFPLQRQYFLSFDIDLHRWIKKPGFLKTFAEAFGYLKIPAPAFGYHTNDGVRFHWFYF